MENQPITKSEKLRQVQVIFVAILSLILILISFKILNGTREILGLSHTTLGLLLRLTIVLVALGALAVTQFRGMKRKYIFEQNRLIITDRPFLSSETKQIISLTPTTVSNLSMEQSFLEKLINVGTISLDVDSYSYKSTYKLAGIDNPKRVLEKIDSFLNVTT